MNSGEIAALVAALLWTFSSMLWGMVKIPAFTLNACKNIIGSIFILLHLVCLWFLFGSVQFTTNPAEWGWLALSGLVGIVAGDGGTIIWPLAVGPALAKQYLLTGDPINAAEAHRIGLINFVSPNDQVVDDAITYATKLAAKAPLAVQYTKVAVNKMLKDAANTAFDTATALEILTFQSEDHTEALAAIAEKREPNFKGR